jgi:hypothetical protein
MYWKHGTMLQIRLKCFIRSLKKAERKFKEHDTNEDIGSHSLEEHDLF